MSNFFIVKSAHTAGPQPNTVTESQKAQAVYVVTTLNYAVSLNAQTAPSEPNSAQVTFAIASLNYA